MANYHGKHLKTKKSRLLRWIGIVCALQALVFAFYVGQFIRDAVQADNHRRQTIRNYMSPAPAPSAASSVSQDQSGAMSVSVEETAEVTQATEETIPPTQPPRFPTIDFPGLRQESEAVVAWLQIPALEIINYPVVLGQDNAYYAAHSWDGEESENGAIFLDFQNQGDFSQVHNILYGHCMKDGSMFQSLGKWEGPIFYESNDRTLLLYLPEETRVYEIFAVERVNALDSRVYKTDYTADEAWTAALEETLRVAQPKTNVTLPQSPEVLTLSTCVGGMTRLVVHALCLERVPA